MSKRTVLILSLIFSVLALIYMIAVQYGLDRYTFLHAYNSEGYINNYHSLPKADKESRVIIHFTAPADRLDKIKPFLNSLLDQTVKVDEIAVSIPYKHIGKLPNECKKALNIYGFSKGYGEKTKVIPALLREKESDTKIIVVEPNVVYGKDFVDEIVEKSNKNPDKMIQSKHAILLKPEFFKDEFITEMYTNKNDDKKKKFHMWLQAVASTGRINLPYKENYKSLK